MNIYHRYDIFENMYFRIGFTRNQNICVYQLVHKIVEDLTNVSLYLEYKYLCSSDINTFYTIFRTYIVDGHINGVCKKFCRRRDAVSASHFVNSFCIRLPLMRYHTVLHSVLKTRHRSHA